MKRYGIRSMTVGLFTVAASLLMAAPSQAAPTPHFTAKIYDLKDHTKLMFDYKSDVEVVGDTTTFVNTVFDLNGETLVIEKTVMKDDGETLVSFEQDQKQLKTQGKVELRDGKAEFTFTRDGKTKTDDEKAGADFIVTATLVAYVQGHWDAVIKGDTVKARLAVLDRMETVGFQFRKDSERQVDGVPVVILKMKPSSLVISALVDPLFFTFTADGKQLMDLSGRANVKVLVDGKLKDFDGYTVYTYPSAAPAAVAAPEAVPTGEPVKPAKSSKKKSVKKK
ncbi:hypothetical protein BH10BDE1_BH10BDE1_15070 [soil metagenome]